MQGRRHTSTQLTFQAVVASAKLSLEARRAEEFDFKLGTVEVDYAAVIEHAKAIRDESRESNAESVTEMDGVTRLTGHARLEGRSGEVFKIAVNQANSCCRLATQQR